MQGACVEGNVGSQRPLGGGRVQAAARQALKPHAGGAALACKGGCARIVVVLCRVRRRGREALEKQESCGEREAEVTQNQNHGGAGSARDKRKWAQQPKLAAGWRHAVLCCAVLRQGEYAAGWLAGWLAGLVGLAAAVLIESCGWVNAAE